jgi:hypothetical protein
MRNFTNFTVFDDTLPVGEAEMEIGSRVSLDELRSSMEDWFHRKGYAPKGSHLTVSEQ